MKSNDTRVPKHRNPADHVVKRPLSKILAVVVGAVAVTVVAISAASALPQSEPDPAAAALAAADLSMAADSGQSAAPVVPDDRRRTLAASRSVDRRPTVDRAKARLLSQASGGQVTRTEHLASGDPRDIARAMLGEFGWGQDQFGCLDSLFSRESGWNPRAANPSGAYGIPQALPGSKMASAGADWQVNPKTQIRWGLGYIASRYGSPCGAWGHSESSGWY